MWPNPEETADLVTFTEEILNGMIHFLCSAFSLIILYSESSYCIQSDHVVFNVLRMHLLYLILKKNT